MQAVKQHWPKVIVAALAFVATVAATWVWTTQQAVTLLPEKLNRAEQRLDDHDVKIEQAKTKTQENREALIEFRGELKNVRDGVEDIKSILRGMAERRRGER